MKDWALALLKIAAGLFPPMAKLLADALSKHTPDEGEESLYRQVTEILPETSRSELARRRLALEAESALAGTIAPLQDEIVEVDDPNEDEPR